MIGVIERVKNNVLLKCSTLNDEIIKENLEKIIDTVVYRLAEDIYSLINDIELNITEEKIRNNIENEIKKPVIKKIKRKLFIDSLALQITNDSYIESYIKDEINMDKIKKSYLKELNANKSSNQLNMTEDLDLTEIYSNLISYVERNITSKIKENTFLVNGVDGAVNNSKKELEEELEKMIKDTDLKYLDILVNELNIEVKKEEANIIEEDKGDEEMFDTAQENIIIKPNKFDKYDDMTLFNKTILSLNTKEEKLTRKENKLSSRKEEIDEKLSITNKNIEANIEKENMLNQKKLELNNREIELNSRLSEAEVIFLNMKPLINGLNKIKTSELKGGDRDE